MEPMRKVPVLQCLAAAALFGAATPATKALLGELGPLTAAGLLYLGAALGTLPFARRSASPARRERRQVVRLGLAVLVGGALAPALLLLGLRTAPAASVALWLNLETAATALLAWAFFREPMNARAWAAVALVTAAGVVLAAPSGFGLAPAAALVALASLGWGLENNLVSVIDAFSPSQVTVAKGAIAGALNLALGIALEGAPRDAAAVLLALAVGTAGYGLSIALHVAGSLDLGATRAQALFSTAPFAGMALSWVFLGEACERAQLGAAALMAGGIALLLTARHGHEHRHEPASHAHEHDHGDGHHDHAHAEGPLTRHAHEHEHVALTHAHAHDPDLHHRHEH